jgi:Tol biopolymer transport system component
MRPDAAALLALAALAGSACRSATLPRDLAGTLLFVSDRSGIDSLYARRLPAGPAVRLTFLDEPVADPALSPDGTRVAFSVGGRIALVSLSTHDVRYLSLGVAATDAQPSWFPDGKRLVIVSRRAPGEGADIFALDADAGSGPESPRRRLLETPADESEPVVAPDGGSVVFVREDNLFRLELASGQVRRLGGGFRRTRQPRFLPSGRLLCLWSEGKRFGIDVLDADGANREILTTGSVYYSSVNPSPDGRYLVASFAYDLRFRPLEALARRGNEELRLLDAHGRPLGALSDAWRDSSKAAVWGR